MNRFITLTISLPVLVLIFTIGCQVALTDEEHIMDKIEKAYDVRPEGKLTIVSEFGAIDVQAAEQNQVEIVVTKAVKPRMLSQSTKDALADFEVTFAHRDTGVHIAGAFTQGREYWQKKLNRLDIRFQITVPKDYDIDVDTAGGGIKVDDLNGTVQAHTSGGSLRFGNIIGTVHGRTSGGSITLIATGGSADLKTSGGSIEVGDVAGDIHAQTSGGNLHFGKIQGSVWGKTSGGSIKVSDCNGDVNVHTSGGSIKLESVSGGVNARTSGGSIRAFLTEQPEEACSVRTSGGSITVNLIPDIAIDVDAETSGGRVSTDFAVASVIQGKVPKNRLKGRINGGGPLMKLRTSGGSIRLQKVSD